MSQENKANQSIPQAKASKAKNDITGEYSRNPYGYPKNPGFGDGVFRRAIRLEAKGNQVFASVEDCVHGFEVTVTHDGEKVTAVEATPRRTPFTSCHMAAEPLQKLIGQAIEQDSKSLNQWMNPQSNCTHWLDLAILAVQHAAHVAKGAGKVKQYQIDVPDETDSPVMAKVFCNDTCVLSIQVADWQIVSGEYQGQSLFKGFNKWASLIDDTAKREAMYVLQKGYFVSTARRFDLNALAGEPANAHAMMRGACFTYSEPAVDTAVRAENTMRDFSKTPERLLKFM